MYSITAQTMQINSLSIPVQISDTDKTIETLTLIDSGAGGKFIDQNYIQKLGIKTQELERPLIARNVDGTPKKKEKLLLSLPLPWSSMEEQNEPDCWSPD